jgi:hypothetical protein
MHELQPEQVHDWGDHYTISGVEGFPETIRIDHARAIPSEDGRYYLFFSQSGGLGQTGPSIWCFFLPMDF